MTIDEAIENLQQAKKQGKKNIILAWWDSKMFAKKDDADWKFICDYIDDKMDWSETHDDLTLIVSQVEAENPK